MKGGRLALNLSKQQMDYLEKVKRETGRSMNDIVRSAIQRQINKEAERKA